MSQHSSLKVSSVGAKHRNVLKRHERVKRLEGNQSWVEKRSVFGLPKIKSMKIKVKKAKAEKAADAAGGTPAGQAAPAAAAAKPAAPKK